MIRFLTIFIIFLYKVSGRVKIIPDERTQYCEGPRLKRGEPAVGNILITDIEFLVSDDEKVTLNGTVTFTKNLDNKIFVKNTGEQLLQGDWHPRWVKVLQDACFDFFNPLDIFYPFYKDQKRCPYKPGVSYLI